MSNPCCVVSDKDSHKGTIKDGSPRTTVAGKIIAVVGSKVVGDSKDKHPKVKTITGSGASGRTTAGGREVAVEGGKVSCGASLKADNYRTTCG